MNTIYSTYLLLFIVFIAFYVIERLPGIIVSWSLVSKAGKPGWTQLVPVYATIIRGRIANSLGLAIGFIASELCGLIVVLVAIIISMTNSGSTQTGTMVMIGVALLFVGDVLYVILRYKFGSQFVIADANGQATQRLRWRSGLLTLLSLKYIHYRDDNPALVNAPGMLGYAKADYVPTGFDHVAIIAGWVGAFSFPLLIPAPVGLVLGVIALTRIQKHPELKGRGRAIFALVWGGIWTVALVASVAYIVSKTAQS